MSPVIQFGPAKFTVSGTRGVYDGIAPLRGNITSTFGAAEFFRVNPPQPEGWDGMTPMEPVGGWGYGLGPHGGCDIDDNLEANAPILAPAPGEVVEVGFNDNVGNFIRLNHGEGVTSKYLHMREHAHNGATDLQVGDWVTRHAIIGNVGTTGKWSSGPHLHWSCRVNGVLTDPLSLVVEELTGTDIEALPLPPKPAYRPQVGDILDPLTPEHERALAIKLMEQALAERGRGITISPKEVTRAGRWRLELEIVWDAVELGG